MRKIKNILFPVIFILLLPIVFADIATTPLGLMIGTYFVVFSVCLFANYGISFIISFMLTRIISKIRVREIAKGLLIITPIMLVFESLFIALIEPRYLNQILATGVFSFVLIFLCYFIIGEKIWGMNGWKAALISVGMSIITNPAYLLPFFV